MSALLLVEDDEKIGRLLASALTANGHEVSWQRTGRLASQVARQMPFDLVLLDLGLPDTDGVDLCRTLRRTLPQCVIVILTARADEMDVIVGLESGADDYLTKPFRLTELLARVRAHLRRGPAGPSAPTDGDDRRHHGDFWLSQSSRRCGVGAIEVDLRPKEFDLLARLSIDGGSAVSREALMADVWDENWFGSTKTLDVHIAGLRRQLAEAAHRAGPETQVPTITTLRSFGYRLDDPAVVGRHGSAT